MAAAAAALPRPMDPRDLSLAITAGNLGHGFSHLFHQLFYVVALLIGPEIGWSYVEVIQLAIGLNVMFGAGALPAGWLGDRWSTTGMMVVFFIGTGVSALLVALASGPMTIAAGLTLVGAFLSIYHPVGLAWLVRHAPHRGRALGVNGVFGMFGPAVAISLGAWLAQGFGWRWAFAVPGAAALLVGFWYLGMVRAGRIRDSGTDAAPVPATTRRAQAQVFVLMTGTILCSSVVFNGFQPTMPKLFASRMELPGVLGVGLMTSACFVTAGLWQYVVGRLSDRYSLKRLYVGGFIAQAVLLATAARLFGWPLALVALFILAANSGNQAPENQLLTIYTPPAWRSTMFGVKFVTTLTVGALGLPLVKWTHDLTGDFALILTIMAAAAAGALLFALAIPDPRHRLPETVPAPVPASAEPVAGLRPAE